MKVKIPHDKLLHFTAGMIISLAFGVAAAISAGILKEVVWDWKLDRGTPEVMDAVATTLGAVLAWLLSKGGV